MTRVYLVHGWEGHSKNYWFPWLERQLRKKGIDVVSLNLPEPSFPRVKEWTEAIKDAFQESDEKTYFVGHSAGCQAIMRYLDKLHKGKKIAGCVFVAPFFDLYDLSEDEMEIARPWLDSKIDFSRLLGHTDNFLCIFSTNDPYVKLEQAEKFKKYLGAKIIIKKERGHFSDEKPISEILDFIR